jgi:hypothetical protein
VPSVEISVVFGVAADADKGLIVGREPASRACGPHIEWSARRPPGCLSPSMTARPHSAGAPSCSAHLGARKEAKENKENKFPSFSWKLPAFRRVHDQKIHQI